MSESGHGTCLHGELASLSTEGVSARFPFNDIEQMCRERSEGSGGSGSAAIQSRTNEGRRWWQYGGGITLDSLVEHQEQTSVGRIAQRRSKKPAKELAPKVRGVRSTTRKMSGNHTHGDYSTERQRNTGVIKLHVVENVRKECGLHTSTEP
jgi:hypothetical protein